MKSFNPCSCDIGEIKILYTLKFPYVRYMQCTCCERIFRKELPQSDFAMEDIKIDFISRALKTGKDGSFINPFGLEARRMIMRNLKRIEEYSPKGSDVVYNYPFERSF